MGGNALTKNFKILLLVLLLEIGAFGFLFFKKEKIEPQINEVQKKAPFNPGFLKWENATLNAAWAGRDAHSTIVFKDKIWLFGGVEGGKNKDHNPIYENFPHGDDIWVSEDGINWQLVKENSEWGERRSVQIVVFKNKLWLIGGWEKNKNGGQTKNDIWASEDGVNWTQITSDAGWPQREGHTAVVFHDKIWVAGGVDFYERETKNDVWFSEDGENWTEAVANAPWPKRYDHSLAVFKDKLWLIGGLDFGNQVKNDVWVSEDGINWQLASDAPPWPARHGHIETEFNNFLWIIGGWNEQIGGLNDTWFSSDGYNWEKIKESAPWAGREDHSSVIFQNKIWLFGGMAEEGENWEWKNDVWYSNFNP